MNTTIRRPIHTMWETGPPPRDGQFQRYPSRFWHYFAKQYPEYIINAYKPKGKPVQVTLAENIKVLHMFSGSMKWGDTTDIRPETKPTIVAPYNNLPIPGNTYDMVVADPPYNKGFANEWITHDKDLPKPKRILVEATRVTKPGGIIAILHIITIPKHPKAFADLGRPGVECIGRHGILCGSNNAIRLLNVFKKKEVTKNDSQS